MGYRRGANSGLGEAANVDGVVAVVGGEGSAAGLSAGRGTQTR